MLDLNLLGEHAPIPPGSSRFKRSIGALRHQKCVTSVAFPNISATLQNCRNPCVPYSDFNLHLRNRKHVPCFYRVIEKRMKFGRMRNAFHSFFEFSQTFTSVSITRQTHGVHIFYFVQKTQRREKGKQLLNFHYQNVNSLCSRHHYVNSARQFCVSFKLYKHDQFVLCDRPGEGSSVKNYCW